MFVQRTSVFSNTITISQINFSPIAETPVFENNSAEMIISFEKISSKQFEDLETALSELSGIKKVGACENMNIYYFMYDPAIYRTVDEAYEALILKTKIYQPLLKIGATVADVKTAC